MLRLSASLVLGDRLSEEHISKPSESGCDRASQRVSQVDSRHGGSGRPGVPKIIEAETRHSLQRCGNVFRLPYEKPVMGVIDFRKGAARVRFAAEQVFAFRFAQLCDEESTEEGIPGLSRMDAMSFRRERAWFLCPRAGCARRVAILWGGTKFYAGGATTSRMKARTKQRMTGLSESIRKFA